MKIKTLILSLIFTGTFAFAQTKSIHFETTSFADMKAKAKRENKLLFIGAFRSWSDPCSWMAKNIFTNDTVADYFNSKFINANINTQKGEGFEIAKLYEVRCFPNLLFIDGDGKLVHRGAGVSDAEAFIKLAEDAFNPEKRFSKFTDEYASKKADPAFLAAYIEAVSKTCLPFEDAVNDYFKTQKDENLSIRANWDMIRDYTSQYNSREFIYLLNNAEIFNKAYTADSVKSKIAEVLLNSGYSIIYPKDYNTESQSTDYKRYIDEIKKINLIDPSEVILTLDMAYTKLKGPREKFIQLAVEKGDKYCHSAYDLNSISLEIYGATNDKASMLKAESWMQKAIKNKPNWHCYDTYASILYELNKKHESKTSAEKAIELAKLSGAAEDEYSGAVELLQKIEKLK